MHASAVTLEHKHSTRRAKVLLRIDAVAEAVCALGLAALAVNDTSTGSWALQSWVSDPMLWIAAAVFAVTAVGLAVLADLASNGRFTQVGLLFLLGMVNAVLAAAIVLWALVGAGFGGGSTSALVVVGIAISLLGIAQMNSFRGEFATRSHR